MAINQTKNKRKLSPRLGCVMGPIFTSLSNDIFHVFSPLVTCPLQYSVRSSLFPFIVFLGFALSVFFSDYLLLQLLRFSQQMLFVLFDRDTTGTASWARTVFSFVSHELSSGLQFFFLCNVMSIIVHPVSCVANVVSVSGLSISNCSFGFL